MHNKTASAQVNLSQLIIIDMQIKLASAMPQDAMQIATKNCSLLTQVASLLGVPIIITEQYPQGLGATLPEITQFAPVLKPIAKTAFSALSEPTFKQQLNRNRSQIMLAGMESHICILQTALALTALTTIGATSGDNKPAKQVFVVEDAIISRNISNKINAVARMRDAGCIVTNTESVLFEWLTNANHPLFKEISQLIR